MWFQFFKLKHGFEPIMSSTQLNKLNLIFKREKMEISAADIVLPSYLDLKWETVGAQFLEIYRVSPRKLDWMISNIYFKIIIFNRFLERVLNATFGGTSCKLVGYWPNISRISEQIAWKRARGLWASFWIFKQNWRLSSQ